MEACPCGSDMSFKECCGPVIAKERPAQTAEELMRSRYSAFATGETDHIWESTHPDQRKDHDKETIQKWSSKSQWLGFRIVASSAGGVEDEEGKVLEVVYSGVKPGNFEEATQIVAVGSYSDGVFECEQLLVKCPSKYQGLEEA